MRSTKAPSLFFLLSLVCAGPVFAQAAGVTTAPPVAFRPAIEQFQMRLANDVETDGVGSITAGVMHGADLVWTESFGWADRDRRTPADAQSIYRVGSISKTVTAVVLMRLVELGVVDLDEPVVRYLPEFSQLDDETGAAQTITLRQLASHTAGLVREPGLAGAASGPIEGWRDKILASIPTTSLLAHPGERYSYSNIGYGMLGLALAYAADRPFTTLAQEYVFDPFGMDATTFILSAEQWPDLAVGYANLADGTIDRDFPAREHAGRGYKVPNGGVYMTIGDLGRFAAGLAGALPNQPLTKSSRQAMLTVQTPGDPSGGYGLGLSIRSTAGGYRAVGHGGSVAGYNAHMVFDPETRIGVVLLRNYGQGATNLGTAAGELLDELVRSARTVP